MVKSSSPSSGNSSWCSMEGVTLKAIDFLLVGFSSFSHLYFHFMGFEIPNKSGEVHLLTII